jgi:hypothetical protein
MAATQRAPSLVLLAGPTDSLMAMKLEEGRGKRQISPLTFSEAMMVWLAPA